MFSGIVEELGVVKQVVPRGVVTRVHIECQKVFEGTKIGDSIAVDGVCLTVVAVEPGALSFEVIGQTRAESTLGNVRSGRRVNLERALRVGDRISGHFVAGHVDCLGTIRKKMIIRESLTLEIAVPQKFMAWCVDRGSVAVDGISLTIARKKADSFEVCIIPHTWHATTLGVKHPSEKVNIEFDMLLKKNG